MVPPPLLNNTGQQGEFVLPLNMPAAAGSAKEEKVDDYTFDAGSWTLIAHEARPGHELQFDSMLEHGVSIARSRYAFNSTNVEGWGLYAEYITKPYMPLEGQLISLQFRLLRAIRAFSDPELQAGKMQPADVMKTLTVDGCFSVPFANQEVERYTFRMPGQANSYFYGYTKLLAAAERHGSRARPEIRSEKIPRLHSRPRIVAARPDAQSGDGGFHSAAKRKLNRSCGESVHAGKQCTTEFVTIRAQRDAGAVGEILAPVRRKRGLDRKISRATQQARRTRLGDRNGAGLRFLVVRAVVAEAEILNLCVASR